MLIAEVTIPDTPWWVTVALGIVTVLLAYARLYDYLERKRIERKKNQHEVDITIQRDLTEEQQETRRQAEDEAWRTVDRLKVELGHTVAAHETKLREIEGRERSCQEERNKDKEEWSVLRESWAADRAIMRIIVNWVMQQRNKPPIPDEILHRFLEDMTGSGVHVQLKHPSVKDKEE